MADDFGLGFDDGFGLGGGLSLGPRKRKRKIDAFTPEDESTILGTIGDTALSGLAAVGNLLDLPGSSVRDVIAGQNPFDQWNPFDGSMISDKNRTTGRDLLRQAGMIGSEDTYGNWWGGLGAEILLDPTTYLSGGLSALGKGGKAFKAVGVLDDAAKVGLKAGRKVGPRLARMTTSVKQGYDLLDDAGRTLVDDYFKKNNLDLASLADEPIQSLGRVEIPFTDIGFNFGTGWGSQKIAGGLDYLGDAAKASAVGRFGRMLFDPSAGGKFGKAEQEVAEEAYKAKWKSEAAVKSRHVAMLNGMSDTYKAFQESFGATPGSAVPEYETFDKLVRLSAEMGDDVEGAWKVLSRGAPNLSPDVSAKVKDLGKQIKDWNKQVHESIASKGGKTGTIMERLADAGVTEGFAHMPRFADAPKPKDWTELGASKVLKTSHAGMLARTAAIREIPAEIVNTMLTDDAIRQAPDATEIMNKFGNYLDPNYEVDGKIVGKQGHAEALKEFVTQHRASPLFTHATAEDFLKYQMGAQAVDRNLDAIHEIVRRNMNERTADGVTVRQAFKHAGLSDAAIEHWAKSNNLHPDLADGFRVPVEVANAIASVNKVYEQPEWAKAIGEAIDSFHSWWKTAMTVPFPSFHSRNFSSGQYMNIATGYVNTPADIAGYGGEVMNSLKMLRNGVPRDLEEELYVYGVRGSHTRAADLAPETMGGGLPVQAQNPLQFFDKTLPSGETALGTFSTAKKAVDEAPSYFDAIPGGKSMRTGAAYITETGSKVADNVEFMNRVPMYLYLTRRKGWSPAEAAAKVNELQVNYSDLAGFEKTVMRRLVPFYAFQRRIAPVLFQTILERPGGTMAQTIKASADLNNADPLTPEHVASTLAAPNPFKSEGFEGSSYITGFGLPHEQFLQYAGGPQAMLREAISNTSPLVKAPLEWAAGQSFFQSGPGGKGRDLEDLDPTIGRTLGNITGTGKVPTPTALEFFAANMPTSRFTGTARQLTDTRKNWTEKGINLLTGAKVTDVSPQNQERLIQQRAMDLMKSMGARTFEKPYFPDELEAEMTPEEASQAEALELLQAVLADRQKKRKKVKN